MNKILYKLLVLIALIIIIPSCIEDGYHWDDLNKDGVLKIPPILLGSYEEMPFVEMDSENITVPGDFPTHIVEYRDTINNFFGRRVIKDFFHQYMERDVDVEGEIVLDLFGEDSNLSIDVDFGMLDHTGKPIEGIDLEGLKDVHNGTQKFSITFQKEKRELIRTSEHLLLIIRLTSPSEIEISEDSYIQLNNLIVKTAGYYVDL